MKPSDKIIIKKIIDYCLQIKETHEYFNNDKNLFLNDEKGFIYRNSITMPILQIGELAKMLSEEFISEDTNIPWRMIMRMRDIVAHHYGSLDYEIVWTTSVTDINDLCIASKEIVKQ